MDDKLSIKVNIAERYYPLRIEREDEEKIRKAARLINEKILQYKQKYIDKDAQDFVAMAALQFVIQYIELESDSRSSALEESLKELNDEIGSYLKNEQ
jgi:cell division protein ZapA